MDDPIKNAEPSKEVGYIMSSDTGGSIELVMNGGNRVYKSQGSGPFSDVDTNISVRAPFGRENYDAYREADRLPTKFPDIIRSCRKMYNKIGIVRNVIDSMTEFAIENMQIIHENKDIEIFYRVWAEKVGMSAVAEEYIRHILREANVVVKRLTAKLPKPVEKEWRNRIKKAGGKHDTKLVVDNKNIEKREIPIGYSILNILNLEKVGGDLARYSGTEQLVQMLSTGLVKTVQSPTTQEEKDMVAKLPEDVRQACKAGNRYVKLDMDKIHIGYYKKDSYEDWALPFLYSIMDDVMYRDKMRLAEITALDNTINVIRIWTLGNSEKKIFPTPAHINKLIDILETGTGGGTMDLVWDDMLKYQEFYPPLDKILGSEKYEVVNRDIMIGIGVPDVLIGGKGSNFSNSYIQLKTIVERLDNARRSFMDFITKELEFIAKAMGFKTIPRIKFNNMNLKDEMAEKALLIQLLDRNILSVETIHDVFGYDFVIELERIKREKKIDSDSVMDRLSPLEKSQPTNTDNKGGRPKNTRDIKDRNRKNIKPRTGNIQQLLEYSSDAVDIVEDLVTKGYLKSIKEKGVRNLSTQQKQTLDDIIIKAISIVEPFVDITEKYLNEHLEDETGIDNNIKDRLIEFSQEKGREPTVKERRNIYATVWAMSQGEENE